MSYYFIEKIVLPAPEQNRPEGRRIMVLEPDPDFSEFICHVLKREFEVLPVLEIEKLFLNAKSHNPEAVVVSTALVQHPELEKFRKHPDFAGVKLISLGDSVQHGDVKSVLGSGFSGHIDRKFSRPQDLANLINCLLIY